MALLAGCAQLDTQQGSLDTSSPHSTASPSIAAPRSAWVPGTPHPVAPNVVAAQTEDEWEPAAGYLFANKPTLVVAWVPGLRHPTAPNVVSSINEGNLTPDDGFEWLDSSDPSFEVRWRPGKQQSKFSNVVAGDAVLSWLPAPGYLWVQPELRVLQQVRWAAGMAHPTAPNVVAGAAEGTWNAASGFEWADSRALSLAVRRLPSLQAANETNGIDWAGHMIKTFESLGTDIDSIRREASGRSSTWLWRMGANVEVGFAGAGTCLIPVAGYAALPVEFLYLMREMYNESLTMGFIISKTADPSDFANILAVWSEEMSLTDDTLRQAYEIAESVTSEIGQQLAESTVERAVETTIRRFDVKDGLGQPMRPQTAPPNIRALAPVVSNALAQKSGAKTAGKLGAKVGAKTGAKLATKYAVKLGAGWIPGASSLACAGANIYIMNDLLHAAELYYRKTSEYRAKRYGRQAPN